MNSQNSYKTVDHMYQAMLRSVLNDGWIETARGLTFKEIINTSWRLENPLLCILKNPVRKALKSYMFAEWLWIASGRNDLEFVSKFNKNLAPFANMYSQFDGAYGIRWIDQLPTLIKRLKNDLYTRQAVVTFWRPDLDESKDIPCTIGLHFIFRDGKLNLTAWMRSNDLWLGVPYDTFTFCQLLNLVAAELKVEIGWYQLNVSSLHLYVNDLEKAKSATLDISFSEQTEKIILKYNLITILNLLKLKLSLIGTEDYNSKNLDGLSSSADYLDNFLKKRCTNSFLHV